VLGLSSLVLFAVEIEKWLVRRGRIYTAPPGEPEGVAPA